MLFHADMFVIEDSYEISTFHTFLNSVAGVVRATLGCGCEILRGGALGVEMNW